MLLLCSLFTCLLNVSLKTRALKTRASIGLSCNGVGTVLVYQSHGNQNSFLELLLPWAIAKSTNRTQGVRFTKYSSCITFSSVLINVFIKYWYYWFSPLHYSSSLYLTILHETFHSSTVCVIVVTVACFTRCSLYCVIVAIVNCIFDLSEISF